MTRIAFKMNYTGSGMHCDSWKVGLRQKTAQSCGGAGGTHAVIQVCSEW